MIVLDATNKSLKVFVLGTLSNSVTAAVSYWSISTSNVWTPHSFDVVLSGVGAATTILSAPVSGETARVVENIWLHVTTTGVPGLKVQLDVGGNSRTIAAISGGLVADMVLTLSRDGSFVRQLSTFSTGVPATMTQNVQ